MEIFLTICGVRAVFASRVGAALMLVFFGGFLALSFMANGLRLDLLKGIALAACFFAVRTLKSHKE